MTLWNLIRDFFVEHIFGGLSSTGQGYYDNVLGQFSDSGSSFDTGYVNSLYMNIGQQSFSEEKEFTGATYICFGDWLSTTFTIITLILLVIFLYIFVKWIFKLFSGLLH